MFVPAKQYPNQNIHNPWVLKRLNETQCKCTMWARYKNITIHARENRMKYVRTSFLSPRLRVFLPPEVSFSTQMTENRLACHRQHSPVIILNLMIRFRIISVVPHTSKFQNGIFLYFKGCFAFNVK